MASPWPTASPPLWLSTISAKSAWSFTLLHELAHLWIGATGVSGASVEIEDSRFSNDVASTFLLPDHELEQISVYPAVSAKDVAREINDFAPPRLLSRSLVAYRLWRADKIGEDVYRTLPTQFRSEWRTTRGAARARARTRRRPRLLCRPSPSARRSTHQLRVPRLERWLDPPTKASKVLGVRPRSVAPLIQGGAR